MKYLIFTSFFLISFLINQPALAESEDNNEEVKAAQDTTEQDKSEVENKDTKEGGDGSGAGTEGGAEQSDPAVKDVDIFRQELVPLIISYIHRKRHDVTHFIMILSDVEFADQESWDKFKLWGYRLHDQLFVHVRKYIQLMWPGRGSLNEGHLRMLMKKVIEQVVGIGKVKKVIIEQVRIDRAP